ncbi:MAG: matrixin family metalloprotease, partial [Deltaproteobacteria bacterium]|nr:matrixin family metalloprotease [Deltaproteobacteria bacterium]
SPLAPPPQLAASPYAYIGARWALDADGEVPYVVNEALSADLSDAQCLGAVRGGFDAWSALECSRLRWRYDGRTDRDGWGEADGANVVSWREASWDDSAAALAITSSIFDLRGLSDTDIKFNGFHHRWGLAAEGVGGRGAVDVQSVAAHEVGHALGLDHSSTPGATMWPSTGPGDATPRTLSQDDIDGACGLYDSGGAVPVAPGDPPPAAGARRFGESCASEACAAPGFCVSDGASEYCSRSCDLGESSCPAGYYCAQLSGGSGACARGADPATQGAGFGETCGNATPCRPALSCLRDEGDAYCSRPCGEGCPAGFYCASLAGGGDVCARGSETPPPVFGELCGPSGRCAEGLFCLSDQLYTDLETGRVLPYCTTACAAGCPEGYRCAQVPPRGDACQRTPSAGERAVGDPCWVNPERPLDDPSCTAPLYCVNARRDPSSQEILEPGYCSKRCGAEDCCPAGWGCLGVTAFLAQCAEGASDDEALACAVAPPAPGEGGAEGGAAGAAGEGCAQGGRVGAGRGATSGGGRGSLRALLLLLASCGALLSRLYRARALRSPHVV